MNKQTDASIRAMKNRTALIVGQSFARMEQSDVTEVRLAGGFIRDAAMAYESGQYASVASALRIAADFMTKYAYTLETGKNS